MNLLFALLIALCGSDHYEVRELAEAGLRALIELSDDPRPVEHAPKRHPDPDVRLRCARAVNRCDDVVVPDHLHLFDFRVGVADRRSWHRGTVLSGQDRRDVREHLRLLRVEKKMTPGQIRAVVQRAVSTRYVLVMVGRLRVRLSSLGLPCGWLRRQPRQAELPKSTYLPLQSDE
jgi:hypothetical protein